MYVLSIFTVADPDRAWALADSETGPGEGEFVFAVGHGGHSRMACSVGDRFSKKRLARRLANEVYRGIYN